MLESAKGCVFAIERTALFVGRVLGLARPFSVLFLCSPDPARCALSFDAGCICA